MIEHIVNEHITPVSTGEGDLSPSEDQMEEDTTQQVS